MMGARVEQLASWACAVRASSLTLVAQERRVDDDDLATLLGVWAGYPLFHTVRRCDSSRRRHHP